MSEEMSYVGHGHVIPRPDGVKARCGGPSACLDCAREQAAIRAQDEHAKIVTGQPTSDDCVYVKLTASQIRSIRIEVDCCAPAWLYNAILRQIPDSFGEMDAKR